MKVINLRIWTGRPALSPSLRTPAQPRPDPRYCMACSAAGMSPEICRASFDPDLGKSRRQYHAQTGPALAHHARQFGAIEPAWHDDVGEQQIHLLPLQQFKCRRRALDLEHAVTEMADLPRDNATHRLVVLDDEHALVGAGPNRPCFRCPRCGESSPRNRGKYSRNDVPIPTSLETLICPPDCLVKPNTIDSPRPVPRPASFVVKNGSKIWPIVSGGMPVPVSLISIITKSPGVTSACVAA